MFVAVCIVVMIFFLLSSDFFNVLQLQAAIAQGWFVIHRLALATINLSTKFELCIFTHYEDMKGDTKYQKLGGLG